jgi:uncharacterized protein YndB with AHSA1/START domain
MDFSYEIDIAAPPERVWTVLTDVERWPEWTASMSEVTMLDPGPLRHGTRARIRQPAMPPAVWTVSAIEPNLSFTWETHRPGIRITAVHSVVPTPSGSHVTVSLQFSGWLKTPALWFAGARTAKYLQMEVEGLKWRSEVSGP